MLDSMQALGGALRAWEIQAAYVARVAVMQRDAVSMEGAQVLELLRAAALPPEQGQRLDVQV